MPPLKTDAVVIKTFDFRETSIIATLYTRDFGKINAILKGIRGFPEKFASTLEPFSHNQIVFYKSRTSGLHLVSQCDLCENFASLRTDIFDLSVDCLNAMRDCIYADKITTIFKIKLLILSGFKPHFDSCISCGERIIGQGKFSIELGGLICPACFKKDLRARNIFRGTIATILHIEKCDLANNLRLGLNPQIKRELDSMLSAFFDFHIDKKIKSQNVLDNLKIGSLSVK